jgi:hypothetical protein
MGRRPTSNEIACAEFRKLLTEGFYAIDADGVILEDDEAEFALVSSKPWRGDLWKAFRALEQRLCPVAAMESARKSAPFLT